MGHYSCRGEATSARHSSLSDGSRTCWRPGVYNLYLGPHPQASAHGFGECSINITFFASKETDLVTSFACSLLIIFNMKQTMKEQVRMPMC